MPQHHMKRDVVLGGAWWGGFRMGPKRVRADCPGGGCKLCLRRGGYDAWFGWLKDDGANDQRRSLRFTWRFGRDLLLLTIPKRKGEGGWRRGGGRAKRTVGVIRYALDFWGINSTTDRRNEHSLEAGSVLCAGPHSLHFVLTTSSFFFFFFRLWSPSRLLECLLAFRNLLLS